MNPPSPRTPREELEARLTALLLGELSADEATAVRRALAQDTELTRLHDRLQATVGLVREAASSRVEPDFEQPALKLSSERREKLLAHFKTVPLAQPLIATSRMRSWLIPVSVAAVFMAILGIVVLPAVMVRSKSLGLTEEQDSALARRTWGRPAVAETRSATPSEPEPASAGAHRDFSSRYGIAPDSPAATPQERYALGRQTELNSRLPAAGDSASLPNLVVPEREARPTRSAPKEDGDWLSVAAPADESREGRRLAAIALPAAGEAGTEASPKGVQADGKPDSWYFTAGVAHRNEDFAAAGVMASPLMERSWGLEATARGFYADQTRDNFFATPPSTTGKGLAEVRTETLTGGRGEAVSAGKPVAGSSVATADIVAAPETPAAGGLYGGYALATPAPVTGLPLAPSAGPSDAASRLERDSEKSVALAETAETQSRFYRMTEGRVGGSGGDQSPPGSALIPPPAVSLGSGLVETKAPASAGALDVSERLGEAEQRKQMVGADKEIPAESDALAMVEMPQINVGLVPRMAGQKLVEEGQHDSVRRGEVAQQIESAPTVGLQVAGSVEDPGRSRGVTVSDGAQLARRPTVHSVDVVGQVDMTAPTAAFEFVKPPETVQLSEKVPVLGNSPLLGRLIRSAQGQEDQLVAATAGVGGVAVNADEFYFRTVSPVRQEDDQTQRGATLSTTRSPAAVREREAIMEATRRSTERILMPQKLDVGRQAGRVGDLAKAQKLDGEARVLSGRLDESGSVKSGDDALGFPATPAVSAETASVWVDEPARRHLSAIVLPRSEARDASGIELAKTEELARAKNAPLRPGSGAAQGESARLIQDGKVLLALGKTEAAGEKLKEALKAQPDSRAGEYYLELTKDVRYQQSARPQGAATKTALAGVEYGRAGAETKKLRSLEDEAAKAQVNVDRLRQEHAIAGQEAGDRLLRAELDAPPTRKASTNAPIPQPEIQTTDNAFSTFSLNVSDVAFKLAAASLEKGQMPDATSVRAEEFINAFDYRDPEAPPGVPVAFAWERARYPFAHNRDLLRFSLKTAAAGRQAGRALNLVLLLDNSGSMERADRVQIILEALRVLAGYLQPQDKLSAITFARTPRLWVDGVAGNKSVEVLDQIAGLTPQGGTNLEEAMNLAYTTALRHYHAAGINRVVLLTDGAANLGNIEPESLKQKVELHRKQGIAFDCFGVGWEGFNDDLLEVLSRNGDGRYGFINSPAEAATEFAGQLAGALQVAASDVKLQVEFKPKRVTAYRQVGYAKHQLTKEQFRDNTVDAAEIAAQEAGNALYIVEVNPAGEGPLCVVRCRFKIPGTADYREHEWAVPYSGNAVPLERASSAMRLAASASAFAEWLVVSPFAAEVTLDALLGYLSGVPEVYGADERPKKLEWMIRQAKSLAGK